MRPSLPSAKAGIYVARSIIKKGERLTSIGQAPGLSQTQAHTIEQLLWAAPELLTFLGHAQADGPLQPIEFSLLFARPSRTDPDAPLQHAQIQE